MMESLQIRTINTYTHSCLNGTKSIFESGNSYYAVWTLFNPIALRKAKIVYNFGLSECNRVKACDEPW